MRKHREALLVAGLACVAVTAAGCTSSDPNPGPAGTSSSSPSAVSSSPGSPTTSTSTAPSSSPTPSSSAPADPRVAAALKAYDNFTTATYVSLAHPPLKIGNPYVKGGDFRPYSFDPAQAQMISYLFSLTEGGIEYKGTAPSPRTSVVSAELTAKPYPTVILTDCPTAPSSWNAYYRATGKPTTSKPGQVKPPYLVTVTVIFYEKHWGVQKLTPNASRTCTAP